MHNIPRFGEGPSKRIIEKYERMDVAFQEFCEDCMRVKYPDFRIYPTSGRDGCIDGEDGSTRVEVKMCNEDEPNKLIQRWKKTETSLRNQLSKGEEECQKQFTPWFSSSTPPMKTYILFTNALLSNKNGEQEVENYISGVFAELSNYDKKLKYLADVKIEVWDWCKIKALLKENPQILCRWFPESWPKGLSPLRIQNKEGFRAFLYSSKLPYYSLEEHEKKTGQNSPIKTERQILDDLLETEKFGRIIYGPAGVGKTRMALQIGQFAEDKGWVVFKANSATNIESITELLESYMGKAPILLIIDYLELFEHFKSLAEEISKYNKNYGKSIFYIATCRQSYYYNIIQDESTHKPISLKKDSSDDWLLQYRREIVKHILGSYGIYNPESYIDICRDQPVLAVLIVYLSIYQKTINISDILEFKEFGSWFEKRLKLTLPQTEKRDIAMFMLCLPTEEENLEEMPKEFENIKNKLSSDKLIEPHIEESTKRYAIHDVVTDHVVIDYCESISDEVRSFVRKSMEFGRVYNCLDSVLVAFQRIADHAVFYHVEWFSLVNKEITKFPEEWKTQRIRLMNTSLLSKQEKIMLLEENPYYWEDLFSEPVFHKTIGWLIGWLCRQEDQESIRTKSLKNTIQRFIDPLLPYIKDNFFICRILEFDSQKYCKKALEWVKKDPDNASFVICAYIRSQHHNEEFEKQIQKWFENKLEEPETYHIFKAFFQQGRISEFETNFFKKWLFCVGYTDKAKKLISIYLWNGGVFEHLEPFIFNTLQKHKNLDIKIDLILHWVRNSNKKLFSIEKYIIEIPESSYKTFSVCKIFDIIISERHKLSYSLLKCCLRWIQIHSHDVQFLWSLNKLSWSNYNRQLTNEFIKTFEYIIKYSNVKNLSTENCSNIQTILHKLIATNYGNRKNYTAVLSCFERCLKYSNAFVGNQEVFEKIQRKPFLKAMQHLLQYKPWLKKNPEKLFPFFVWFGRWKKYNKKKYRKEFDNIVQKNPSLYMFSKFR